MIPGGYPLSHGTNAQTCSCLRPLSHGLSRASSPIGRAKGRALPAQRNEIFAVLISQLHPHSLILLLFLRKA